MEVPLAVARYILTSTNENGFNRNLSRLNLLENAISIKIKDVINYMYNFGIFTFKVLCEISQTLPEKSALLTDFFYLIIGSDLSQDEILYINRLHLFFRPELSC